MCGLVRPGAGGQFPNGGDGASCAIGHPLFDERLDGIDAVARDEFFDAALANLAGSDLGAIVAIPQVRYADLHPAHANDVRQVLVLTLDPQAGEMQTLLVDGTGVRKIGRWNRCAYVRMV